MLICICISCWWWCKEKTVIYIHTNGTTLLTRLLINRYDPSIAQKKALIYYIATIISVKWDDVYIYNVNMNGIKCLLILLSHFDNRYYHILPHWHYHAYSTITNLFIDAMNTIMDTINYDRYY